MYTVDDHIPKTPPTHKDVLLERYRIDTLAMAKSRIGYNASATYYTTDHDGKSVYYKTYDDAVDGEIAYLNSAAEVGK